MGDAPAAAHACQYYKVSDDVCAYVDIGLDSLHAKAERRRGLPWDARLFKQGICIFKLHLTDVYLS